MFTNLSALDLFGKFRYDTGMNRLSNPILSALSAAAPLSWTNPSLSGAEAALPCLPIRAADMRDASTRLDRLAPVLAALFPQLEAANGRIESPLTPIPAMRDALYGEGVPLCGRLLLKRDCDLPVSGSIKARGGVYEVLCHAEQLALAAGVLSPDGDPMRLLSKEARTLFAAHTIQVGSTGNLGLSIGLTGAALGFSVTVHMSADARVWKKRMLAAHGVEVREYAEDYSAAVKNGRRLSEADPNSYFVDDETSRRLFLGYAVAAERVQAQLRQMQIPVDAAHPLFVYLPCGVGGGPAGVTFGLKALYGDAVHAFFVEPVQAPCVLLGLASGKNDSISVQDIGLSGKTQADGLAVGRASGLVCTMMRELLSGACTDTDRRFTRDMCTLYRTEGLFVEPSAAAGFSGLRQLFTAPVLMDYLDQNGLRPLLPASTHIVWATGGALVPAHERAAMLGL